MLLTVLASCLCAASIGLQIWLILGPENNFAHIVLNILLGVTFALVFLWQIICESKGKSTVVSRNSKISIWLVVSLGFCLALKAVCYCLAVNCGQPVVAAIKQYNQEHRRPPRCLDDLIPTYLRELPGTALFSAANFSYDLTFQDSDGRTTSVLYGQPIWILRVHGWDTDIKLLSMPGVPDDMPIRDDRPIEKMYGQR